MNDNPRTPKANLDLEAKREAVLRLAEQVMSTNETTRRRNEELVRANEQLQQHVDEAHAAQRVAQAQQEGEVNFLDKLAAILGKVAVAVALIFGVVWLVSNGYVTTKPGVQIASVASDKESIKSAIKEGLAPTENALAGVDKKLNDFDKRLGFAELQTKGVDERLRQIVQDNVVKGDQPAITTVVTMENWPVLNVASRSKIFADACQGKVTWDSVNTELYQAGLAYITTKTDAEKIVSTCDVDAIVKKAPAATIEANNTPPATTDTNPYADEDEAARNLQRAVAGPEDQAANNVQQAACERGSCNLTVTPPSPFIQPGYGAAPYYGRPGYGRPGYGPGRCGPGRHWSQEFQACATGRLTAGVHRYDEPGARCVPGEVRVKEVPIPGGVRRIHQTCTRQY